MPVNPKSIENLRKGRRFGPGNRCGGRKKLPDIDAIIAEALADEQNGRTAAEAIILRQRKMAIEGDQRAAEYLLDRAYGKPKQTSDVNITERQKQIAALFPTREEYEEAHKQE